jgi:M-phase inducer tyrosine phosphatase
MDDPNHLNRRDSDLHNFRSFGRTKSYTFGESSSSNGPACPPMAFAAASAAVGRRGNHATTIAEEEDHETSSPNGAADSSGELADSPCPRAVSMGQGPLFGSAKPRALGRLAFQRNASYAGIGLTR